MKGEKALVRAVMRLLHPDLFSAFPKEQEINSAALKVPVVYVAPPELRAEQKLNHYLDELAAKATPEPVSLRFWIKKERGLGQICARLEGDGLLAPLYRALDLISEQDYVRWTADAPDRPIDIDLLDWLKGFVGKVVKDGERHSLLRARLTHTKAEMETNYQLKNLQMGSEFGIGVEDLKKQLDLLSLLDDALCRLGEDTPNLFRGLSLCLHLPEGRPLDLMTQATPHSSWISDDGCLHLVVESESISQTLAGLDLDRAGLLTRLHSFWERRAADLRLSMKELFNVEDVLCDVSTGANAQQFVLWAGYLLANRDEISHTLSGSALPLTLLVHSDESAPMVDYSAASATLHVRTDCAPMYFLNFLQSERCLKAGEGAKEMLTADTEEQRILEAARKALGAKHVIRICSVYERQHAIRAAERLIEDADSIRRSIDLSDAGIAIDSSYQTWESGFISIPYDYHATDLRPNLRKLIGDGRTRPSHPRRVHRRTPTTSALRTPQPRRLARRGPRPRPALRSPMMRFV